MTTISQRKKKVLIIGGGSGAPGLVPGFNPLNYKRWILIPMSDSGGGAAIVGGLFNLPAFSDLDRALISLAGQNISPEMRILMSHRLEKPVDNGLLKVRASNLVTSTFANHYGDIQKAADAVGRLIGVPVGDRVYPSTLVKSNLVAVLQDGVEICGEHEIDDPYLPSREGKALDTRRINNPISDLKLVPENIDPNPDAIEAILNSDIILLAPGSLYTSIIAGLVVPGISDAICKAASKGTPIVLVVNLMTKPYQTDHLALASSQLNEVTTYLPCVSHVIVNSAPIPDFLLEKYKKEGQTVVVCDLIDGDTCKNGAKVVTANLLGDESRQTTLGKIGKLSVLRHNPYSVESQIRKILLK